MTRPHKILGIVIATMFLTTLPACTKVGSERWCKKMEDKSAADWTPREAKDYAKHCVFDWSLGVYQQILSFWFEEIDPALWWKKDNAFDALLHKRFSQLHTRATQCELYEWRKEPEGRLAEIIVLDQFSRNMFRNSARAFASDAMSLTLSQEAIACGADQVLTPVQRSFLYMPFMHSESLKIHEVAADLFRKNGIQNNLDFEFSHKKIIEQFGRYPHRNKILGRLSTAEEIEFLTQPGSSF